MATRGLNCSAEGLAKLPKIKCPRGTIPAHDESPRFNQKSPKTPRRRDGRLSAGAAFSLFSRSPVTSPRAAFDRSFGGTFHSSTHPPSSDPPPFLPWGHPPSLPSSKLSLTPQQLSSALSSLTLTSPSATSAIGTENGKLASPRSRTRICAQGERGASAGTRDARLEASEAANEDLLLFFYQMDLNMRLQRALNMDQYEPAQQLREKIAEVEREISRLRDAKSGGVTPKDDAQDKGIILLSLKAELSRAIEQEDYEAAADLKGKISRLESETLAASAAAMVSKTREYEFRLGQRVKHKICGYTGVIAGMDHVCGESEGWRTRGGFSPDTLNRPFYQVLVDVKAGVGFPVAYVPESSLEAPEEPCRDRFDHPYNYLLFLGMDARGDFIPCQQLREKYNAPRHEVDSEEDGEDEPKGP